MLGLADSRTSRVAVVVSIAVERSAVRHDRNRRAFASRCQPFETATARRRRLMTRLAVS